MLSFFQTPMMDVVMFLEKKIIMLFWVTFLDLVNAPRFCDLRPSIINARYLIQKVVPVTPF